MSYKTGLSILRIVWSRRLGCIWNTRAYCALSLFFFQAEDGIRYLVRSRGLGDVYKRQALGHDPFIPHFDPPVLGTVPPRRRPVTINPRRNDWRLDQCDRRSEKITVTIPPTGTAPKADVYLLADTTGSMAPVIDAVKAGADAILSDPALAAFDVAWGVGNYRDFTVPAPNSYAFQHQLAPTTSTAAASGAISTWNADEGGDTPEGQLYALQELATNTSIGWRTDSKRIIVWFGDAPGHDPICTDLTGLPAAITEATATAALTGANITVVAVSTTTGVADALDGDPNSGSFDYPTCAANGTAGQATRITAATGGEHRTRGDPGRIVSTPSDPSLLHISQPTRPH